MTKSLDKFHKDKKPDLIDRIQGYLIGDRSTLSKRDDEMHIKLKYIIGWILKKNSKEAIIKSMQTEKFWESEGYLIGEAVSERQAYNIYNLAVRLLPKIDTIDKEVERISSRKKYIELAKKAEKMDDIKTAMMCYDKADQLAGLYDKKEADKADASMYFQNVQINVMRSSDPNVYYEKQKAVRERLIQEFE